MLCNQKNEATRAPPRHRRHQMQAGGRIEHEIAGRQLDLVRAVSVLDHELAAVIFLGLATGTASPTDRCGCAARETVAAHRIVDMDAEMMAVVRRIAIEQRREDVQRDRGREKQRIGGQRRDDAVAELRATSLSGGNCSLRLTIADWAPAVERPSSHSLASMMRRNSATSSLLRTRIRMSAWHPAIRNAPTARYRRRGPAPPARTAPRSGTAHRSSACRRCC